MLDDSISDAELSICEYNLFRKDRTRNGGGCAIYVYVSINVVHIDLLLDNSVETLWCKIKPVSGEIMLLCCVYRPPSSSVKYFDNMLDNIEKALNRLKRLKSQIDLLIVMLSNVPSVIII